MARRYWVGTSGWVYPHWREVFYPPDLPSSRWLPFYVAEFPTVEVNSSFYRLPQEKTFAGWRSKVPDDFRFAVKASRFITHIKRLKDCREPVETFLGRARALDENLGPVLYQMPPNFHRNERNEAVLADFLSAPAAGRAARLRVPARLLVQLGGLRPAAPAQRRLLRLPHGGPADAPGGDHRLRLHAIPRQRRPLRRPLRRGGAAALGRRPPRSPRGREDVYIYFNNDAGGFAVQNARQLKELLAQAS